MSRVLVAVLMLLLSLSGCSVFQRQAAKDKAPEASAPAKQAEQKKNEVVACDRLNATAEWKGAQPQEMRNVCNYAAPGNCRIRNTPAIVHAENNGHYVTLLSDDKRSLTTTATARSRGATEQKTKGWIEVSVFAALECS